MAKSACTSRGDVVNLCRRRIQLEDVTRRERQVVLGPLERRANGVVHAGRRRHLDVRAQHAHDLVRLHESRQALDTGSVHRPISNVQTTGIDSVAGEQQPRLAIVDRDRRRLVAGNRQDVEQTAAQVQRDVLGRSVGDPEEALDIGELRSHERRVRLTGKLGIAAGVIAVRVRECVTTSGWSRLPCFCAQSWTTRRMVSCTGNVIPELAAGAALVSRIKTRSRPKRR
jgi:hypothetical protein